MSSMHCDYAGGLLPYRAIQNMYEAEFIIGLAIRPVVAYPGACVTLWFERD